MKHIKTLEIINYQSHQHTIIEPGGAGQLSVVTGSTDSGKTSMFRALRWLLYNGPLYFRTGTKAATVTAWFDDGYIVTRSRTTATNRYIVVDPSGHKETYEGFNRDVPLEVQLATGVRTLEIGDSSYEINMARQHDPAFLVSGISAPARAKVLGQLAGAEAVDHALKGVGSDVRRGQDSVRTLESEVATLESQLTEYDYLPALKERIGKMELLREEIAEATERRVKIASVGCRIGEIDISSAYRKSTIDELGAILPSVKLLLSQAESSQQRQRQLDTTYSRILEIDGKVAVLNATMDRTRGAADAKKLLVEAEVSKRRMDELRRLGVGIHKIGENLIAAGEVVLRTTNAKRSLQSTQEAQEALSRRNALESIVGSVLDVEARIQQAQDRLKVDPAKVLAVVKEAEKFVDRWDTLYDLQFTINGISSHIGRTKDKITKAQSDLESARKEYEQLLREAGKCPTCGSDTHEIHLGESA